MNTTKVLGEAIGIQSQGTIDKTETQTNVGLTSAVIVGQFMRGRLDQPMVIHQGNIRGQLGYEPQNPFYVAVQDCLDTGVPSVQVLRVGSINDDGGSCVGSISYLQLYGIGVELALAFWVNSEFVGIVDGGLNTEQLNNLLNPYGLSYDPDNERGAKNARLINNTQDYIKIKVAAGSYNEDTNEFVSHYYFWVLPSLDNSTVSVKGYDYDTDELIDVVPEVWIEDGPRYVEVSACLAPPDSISCDGALTGISWASLMNDMLFNKTITATSNDITKTFNVGTEPWENLALEIDAHFLGMFGCIFAYGDGWGFDTFGNATSSVRITVTANEPLDTSIGSWQQLSHLDANDIDVGFNPTLIQNSNSFSVCVKTYSGDSICCDGATSSCELENDVDGTAYQAISEIIVNSVSYTRVDQNWFSDFNFPPNSVEIIRTRRIRPGSGYYDYYMEVNNLSNEYLKMEFIGYPNNAASSGNTNPTLGFIDGEIPKAIVCLSPYEPPWDIEYVYLGEIVRVQTGSNIPDFSDFGNKGATSLKINNTVTRIGDAAFRAWSDAQSLELSNTVKEIGNGAFSSWVRATTLIIPEGVEKIGGESFDHWRLLKTLTLPSSITSINTAAFDYCSSLEKITINAINPPVLHGAAFWETNNAPIYVPQQSVNSYKTAQSWTQYASRIFPIP